MSRTLNLPDEVYEAVASAAAQAKSTPVEWIARQAAKAKQRKSRSKKKPKTLYELMKDHIGKVKGVSLKDLKDDPRDPFFNYLLEKKREGHL